MPWRGQSGGCAAEGIGATSGYSGTILVHVLWSYSGGHFGGCAAEAWWCCRRAHASYSGPTLVDVLWKGWCGLLRGQFGGCAVEGLVWAWICGGRSNVGYSGATLVDVLWKG